MRANTASEDDLGKKHVKLGTDPREYKTERQEAMVFGDTIVALPVIIREFSFSAPNYRE
jgi:hypothetical protein